MRASRRSSLDEAVTTGRLALWDSGDEAVFEWGAPILNLDFGVKMNIGVNEDTVEAIHIGRISPGHPSEVTSERRE